MRSDRNKRDRLKRARGWFNGGGGSAGFVDAFMYGATGFSPTSYYATPATGGEPGVGTGFGALALIRIDSQAVTNTARIIIDKQATSPLSGYSLFTDGTNSTISGFIISGSPGYVSPNVYTIRPSDVGKILLVGIVYTGTTAEIWVQRVQTGPLAAISGYSPATTPTTMMGARATGLFPADGITIFAHMTFRGVLNAAQRAALYDATRALGDFPSTIAGGTVTHRWSIKGELNNVPAAQGAPAPATLADRITGAPIDLFTKAGVGLTLNRLDPGTAGRRTLGAQGFSATNYLQTAPGLGIRGSASGFTAVTRVRPDAVGVAGVIACCTDTAGANGWLFQAPGGATLKFLVASASAYTNSASYTFTAADVGRDLLFFGRYTGTGVDFFMCPVGGTVTQIGSFVAGAFTPAANTAPTQLGTWLGPNQFLSNCSVFALAGGNGVATLAQMQACADETASTGVLASIAGLTSGHTYDLTTDILASNVDAVPAQVLDRVGTDNLTKQGVDVRTDANNIRGVGPYSTVDYWSTAPAGGIQGDVAFNVEVDLWFNAVPTSVQYFACCSSSGNATGWWGTVTASGLLRFVLGTSGVTTAGYQITAGDLNKRLRFTLNKTTAVIQLYGPTGAQVGADAASTTYAANAATVPMQVGQLFGANGPSSFTSGYVFAIQGGSSSLVAGDITALYASPTTSLPSLGGTKTQKRYVFEQDIAAANGLLPGRSTERVSGSDDLVRIGAPLTVAQRTERLWSYETSPLFNYIDSFSASNNLSGPASPQGSLLGLHVGLLIRITSQLVSTPRLLAERVNASFLGGWSFQTTGANATLNFIIYNAAGTGIASTGLSIGTSDIGKLLFVVGVINPSNGNVQLYANRVLTGAGNALATYTTPTPNVAVGSRLGGTFPASELGILGVMGGESYLTLAEYQALADRVMATERIAGDPVKSSWLVDFKQDIDAAGGSVPATLLDRIGSANLTRNGTPSANPVFDRSWDW